MKQPEYEYIVGIWHVEQVSRKSRGLHDNALHIGIWYDMIW